ncbi:hypothetical protein MLD38_028814 [Melastoma candidum]|uniref:Uncharacterized protein n=1 Tax=Melastoma candidum TaxID=119954 RepID=A0ACB9N1W6_9MYRT|nr:hypothetical protein MLD38_028814 [Melastoma candidum]
MGKPYEEFLLRESERTRPHEELHAQNNTTTQPPRTPLPHKTKRKAGERKEALTFLLPASLQWEIMSRRVSFLSGHHLLASIPPFALFLMNFGIIFLLIP